MPRNPNLTQAFIAAAVRIEAYPVADDEFYDGMVNAFTSFIMDLYGLNGNTNDIVADVIAGKASATKAVKVIKALGALYDEEV